MRSLYNQRLRSDYNDLGAFRQRVIEELVRARELRATCYKPKLLTDVLNEMRSEMEHVLKDNFTDLTLDQLSQEQLLALQSFFQYVLSSDSWQNPRPTDNLPPSFLDSWLRLNLVARDQIAVQVATEVSKLLTSAAKKALERETAKRVAEREAELKKNPWSLCRIS
jgi:hypothetical protein